MVNVSKWADFIPLDGMARRPCCLKKTCAGNRVIQTGGEGMNNKNKRRLMTTTTMMYDEQKKFGEYQELVKAREAPVAEGHLRDSGRRRLNPESGEWEIVWQITEAGVARGRGEAGHTARSARQI
jgi:hypothetical protein